MCSTLGNGMPPLWTPHWEKLVHSVLFCVHAGDVCASLLGLVVIENCRTNLRRREWFEQCMSSLWLFLAVGHSGCSLLSWIRLLA
jgi:hypothetical protein